MKNIVMLGAPGAGKGTIAAQMEERYDIPHISSGDIFRENIKNNTELGKKAKGYIDKGELVPDDLTIELMIDTLKSDKCENGFILDGFPRTIEQAIKLDESLKAHNKSVELVILVDATDKQIIERLSGRRVCEKCNSVYHTVNMPPKVPDICDKCGSKLVHRKDDTEEVIRDRLDTYNKVTKPLIDYYKEKKILKRVPGFVDSQAERLNLIDALVKGDWATPNY
ncbi:MAG: adenylate kinase [Lachnospiraceae bacterium]|nr:adenylate kinase [Lachnospiraceae bacterium]